VIGNNDIKSDLKNVLREHLEKRVSAVFLDQSLALIDQAAISKESFAVAADRISKRVALFIDNSLSQTIYSNLMELIGTSSSPRGIRRRYPRVDFLHDVLVKYNGKQFELNAENISEGGIFIKTEKTFPINAKIEIILTLESGNSSAVEGIVVNKRSFVRGTSEAITGMGIEFKDIDKATAGLLRNYTQKLYTE
jgi:Tfp pilus assembly protein PilZ